MKHRFKLYSLLCVCALLGIGAHYFIHNGYKKSPTSLDTQDAMRLGTATETLRDYAQKHEGRFPELISPIVINGLSTKAICVVSNLPERTTPTYGHLTKPYPFLYFPLDTPENAKLPLFVPSSGDPDTGAVPEKILTASLVTFYFSGGKELFRNVDFYAGGGQAIRESDFQKFLNGGSDSTAPQ